MNELSYARRDTAQRVRKSEREAPGVGLLRPPSLLFQPGEDTPLLQPREFLHEHLALEMIHLVLDAHGEHALGRELERLAFRVEGSDTDHGGAIHEVVILRDGEAPFFGVGLAFGRYDFRVDEAVWLLAIDADIADKNALVDVDLGGRKPYAGCRIHGLEQVGDEGFELNVEFCDRLRANS